MEIIVACLLNHEQRLGSPCFSYFQCTCREGNGVYRSCWVLWTAPIRGRQELVLEVLTEDSWSFRTSCPAPIPLHWDIAWSWFWDNWKEFLVRRRFYGNQGQVAWIIWTNSHLWSVEWYCARFNDRDRWYLWTWRRLQWWARGLRCPTQDHISHEFHKCVHKPVRRRYWCLARDVCERYLP